MKFCDHVEFFNDQLIINHQFICDAKLYIVVNSKICFDNGLITSIDKVCVTRIYDVGIPI